MIFNPEISAAGNRHTELSVICLGNLFHQAWWPGGVPKSRVCAETLLDGWFEPFGAPRILTTDRGVHNRGYVQDLLRIHGVQLRLGGVHGSPLPIGAHRAARQCVETNPEGSD